MISGEGSLVLRAVSQSVEVISARMLLIEGNVCWFSIPGALRLLGGGPGEAEEGRKGSSW